jgi:hypothetical protein
MDFLGDYPANFIQSVVGASHLNLPAHPSSHDLAGNAALIGSARDQYVRIRQEFERGYGLNRSIGAGRFILPQLPGAPL